MPELEIKWACPKCGATHEKHGAGGSDKCKDRYQRDQDCQGLVCECDDWDSGDEHGASFEHPCPNAVCYHCDWEGRFPPIPKKLAPWEKKALEAGWMPPKERKKELGL